MRVTQYVSLDEIYVADVQAHRLLYYLQLNMDAFYGKHVGDSREFALMPEPAPTVTTTSDTIPSINFDKPYVEVGMLCAAPYDSISADDSSGNIDNSDDSRFCVPALPI